MEIRLNVYDFVKHDTMPGAVMSMAGVGIHHSGLQIGETEYTYNNAGIRRMAVLRMPFCRLNESLALGKYYGEDEDIEATLEALALEFPPGSYDVLKRNCNHFSEALAQRLLGTSIPAWVNRSANIAAVFIPSKKPQDQAPNDDPIALPSFLRSFL